MVKNEKFRDFIWRITKASKLRIKLGSLQKAFQDEIAVNVEAVRTYFNLMEGIWDSWKELNNIDFISQFVEDLGPMLFLTWLSDVFPFNYDRLRAKCPKSPSTEEALLEIFYDFDTEELKIIKDALTALWINESIDHIAQILFIEAIKAISGVFSEIIKHPFKIYTANVDLTREYGTLKIHYFGAGRVEK